MADMNAADVLGVDWARRARELLAGARNRERTTEIGLPRPGRPVPEAPTNPLYTALADPELNRGLANLASATLDAVVGEGTGNFGADLVLGLTGPGAAIGTAATGNKPGVLDMLPGGGFVKALPAAVIATARKGLRHSGKIGERVTNFVLTNYGEEGLKVLDDYVDRFPKVGNLNVNDAFNIIDEGRTGKQLPLLENSIYQTYDPINTDVKPTLNQLRKFFDDNPDAVENIVEKFGSNPYDVINKYEGKLAGMFGDNNMLGGATAFSYIAPGLREGNLYQVMRAMDDVLYGRPEFIDLYESNVKSLKEGRKPITVLADEDVASLVNDNMALQIPGLGQDLDKIEAQQLKSEANRMAKKAQKAQKAQKQEQAPAEKQAREQPAQSGPTERELEMARRTEEARKRLEAREQAKREEKLLRKAQKSQEQATPAQVPETAPEVKETAQEMAEQLPGWKKNGWTPSEHPMDWNSVLHTNRPLTDEEKRDAFVLDSLATQWANQLRETRPVNGNFPGKSTYRHRNTNYGGVIGNPGVAGRFIEDVVRNVRSGNMPKKAFSIYRAQGRQNPLAKTIDANGFDLYNTLFKKKVDSKLNELNELYHFNAFDDLYNMPIR